MRSFLYRIFLLFLLYYLSGCSLEPKPKEQEELPLWVNNHSLTQAVGTSEVNFQGVYTQQAEALNEAKSQLAHNIRSYITSSLESELKVNGTEISNKFRDKINALSEVFLSESYQVDAYFDSQRKLYILVESSKERIDKIIGRNSNTKEDKISIPSLSTRPFKKDELIKSKCYSTEILQTINTKSALFQNKPVWFFRPNQNGVFGSVGIAEKSEGMNFLEQKKAASVLAKSSLLKDKKMQIESEHELLKIVDDEISGEIFESSAVIRSKAKSISVEQKDIWLDPKSCELYIWIVRKDEI
jgi:hypothetical protein